MESIKILGTYAGFEIRLNRDAVRLYGLDGTDLETSGRTPEEFWNEFYAYAGDDCSEIPQELSDAVAAACKEMRYFEDEEPA